MKKANKLLILIVFSTSIISMSACKKWADDETPPTIKVLSPINQIEETLSTNVQYTFSIEVSDAESEVASVKIYDKDDAIADIAEYSNINSPTKTFTHESPLFKKSGTKHYIIEAIDAHNNRVESSFKVHYTFPFDYAITATSFDTALSPQAGKSHDLKIVVLAEDDKYSVEHLGPDGTSTMIPNRLIEAGIPYTLQLNSGYKDELHTFNLSVNGNFVKSSHYRVETKEPLFFGSGALGLPASKHEPIFVGLQDYGVAPTYAQDVNQTGIYDFFAYSKITSTIHYDVSFSTRDTQYIVGADTFEGTVTDTIRKVIDSTVVTTFHIGGTDAFNTDMDIRKLRSDVYIQNLASDATRGFTSFNLETHTSAEFTSFNSQAVLKNPWFNQLRHSRTRAIKEGDVFAFGNKTYQGLLKIVSVGSVVEYEIKYFRIDS